MWKMSFFEKMMGDLNGASPTFMVKKRTIVAFIKHWTSGRFLTAVNNLLKRRPYPTPRKGYIHST